jgi:hypothetical protein
MQESDTSKLEDLGKLVKLVWKKRKNKTLLETIEEAEKSGDTISCLSDLK